MTDYADLVEEESSGGFFNYLPAILWQRRWLVIPPVVLGGAAGLAAALLLPTSYQSTATLLVESQELPETIVGSPTTSIIDQRIAKMRQQVLSRGDLIELIERNDLYPEERRSEPLSEVVETMREATTVQAVNADVAPTPQGTNTIAFSMGYSYRDPVKAQAVMQSLVERFLEIDTANMAEQATSTVSFLQDQANGLQRQIAAIEGQITAIKGRNGAALATSGVPTSANAGSYDAQIAALQSENRQLLRQARRPAPTNSALNAAEAQLAAARAIYTENHPDIAILRERVEQLRQMPVTESAGSDEALIQSQIAANNATIAALGRARSQETARASSTMAAQSRAPVIMEQVMQLDNRANSLRLQLQDVSAKLLSAQNSARMAQEQKGERLSVVDPPVVPDSPTSPNRPLLILGGLGAGLGLGLLLALMLEFVLRPIRGVDQISGMGLEPLAVVPTFAPDRPRSTARFSSKQGRQPAGAAQG
jgi:polysaccharide biosynthesis transport protein